MFVILLSDLLLMTRVEPDNSLLVVDYPILLHDIVESHWRDTESEYYNIDLDNSLLVVDYPILLHDIVESHWRDTESEYYKIV